jgi:hypothetical protein
VNKTARRCPSVALAIAAIVLAPGLARGVAWADDPPLPPPPSGDSPYEALPPGYGPPVYAPGSYAPMVNGPEKMTDVDDESPVPYGYTRVYRKRRGPIIGGAISLGVSYTFTAWMGLVLNDIETKFGTPGKTTDFSWLYIPVAGPFLQLGHMNKPPADFRYCFVMEGITQTVGAALLLYGLSSPQTILMRKDQLSVVPMIGAGTSGLTVAGRF